MALIDKFRGEAKSKPENLHIVLDEGLLAAEGKEEAMSSGSDDLRFQFTHEGKLEPDWLNRVDPKLALVYRNWITENRSRVDAVLKRTI